ncbi:unnamed protein product [Calicophoron daubneyi]|uniref:Uncharacterized protein n=1 Tax=Calicophoron daubneyi TaxID=300641 RepID=A0AAV2T9V4_CALDB
MPEPLSVDQFISDTLEDVRHPLRANFISKISSVRCTVHQLDEGLENDKNVLLKTRKLFKSVVTSGIGHADNILALCEYMEKLGQFALESNDVNGNDVAASLCKFSVVHRDLANMSKHLMQNMNSIVVFPLETFMQGDLKADLKKPFEKALKDYEWKYDKLRKEKLQVMKDTGIFKPDAFTAEMTEELEKERHKLQWETCEYLIKVNELKSKRSAELLQHLIDFYYAQSHYLRECLGVMEHFGKSMNDLATRVSTLQKLHDAQKRRLVDTREEIRTLLEKESDGTTGRKSRPFGQSQAGVTYAAQPTQINRAYGTKKSGFLLKKSEGKVKRVWQKRRVRIADGELWLYHSDESKPPVRLALLTCQVKLPVDTTGTGPPGTASTMATTEADGSSLSVSTHSNADTKNHFDLVSNSRTYNFQAEDDQEFEEWISVLHNAMQEEFHRAMNGDEQTGGCAGPADSHSATGVVCSRNNNNAGAIANPTAELYSPQTGLQGRYPLTCAIPAGSGGSLGESLPGSEHDLLDSSSPTSRSRDSHISRLGSADALTTDLMHSSACGGGSTELKGRALRSSIQSSLRWCCSGNEVCADCDRPDPEWVSVNLGVFLCLECCGAHRELGVHCSRTQSLMMDDLSLNQLLLPRFVGNRLFNEVFESSLASGIKPKPIDNLGDGSGMLQRRTFIKAKYTDRRYITSTTSSGAISSTGTKSVDTTEDVSSSDALYLPRDPLSERFLRRDLFRAVKTGDLSSLIQVYAEKLDLMTPFQSEDGEGLGGDVQQMTALHVAVEQTRPDVLNRIRALSVGNYRLDPLLDENGSTKKTAAMKNTRSHSSCRLALVEYIIQNSHYSHVQRTNSLGETALHHAGRYGCVDALRLLLQAGGIPTPMLRVTNKMGQTALQLVEEKLGESDPALSDEEREAYSSCLELLKLAENAASLSFTGSISDAKDVSSRPLLFSSSDVADRALAARTTLIEALDQFISVDWNLTDAPTFLSSTSTAIGTKGRTPCHRTASSSQSVPESKHSAERLNSTGFSKSQGDDSEPDRHSLIVKQITFDNSMADDGTGEGNEQNGRYHPHSSYGNILATLPRKKGPAPRPPAHGLHSAGPLEFDPHYESPKPARLHSVPPRDEPRAKSVTNFSSVLPKALGRTVHKLSKHTRNVSNHSTGARKTQSTATSTPQSSAVSEKQQSLASPTEGQDFTADLSRLADLMHSSLYGDKEFSFDSSGLNPFYSPKHEANGSRQKASGQSDTTLPLSPSAKKAYHSNDHIDVLLDVLEEKPAKDQSSPDDAPPVPRPPPVPPKPSVPSSLLYSTLPVRGAARHALRSGNLPSRITPTVTTETKQMRSVLPTTPRLPKPSLFPGRIHTK